MDLTPLTNFMAHLPVDWIIIGIFAIFVVLESIRAGTNRACSIALALPVALFAYSQLPQAIFLGTVFESVSSSIAQAAIFFILVALGYIFVHRILSFYSDSSSGIASAVLAGLGTTAILVLVWLQIPALDSIWHFGDQVQMIFGGAYRFWWLMAAYAALAAGRS